MVSEFTFRRERDRLAGLDFGGSGSPVLLLHGLAGYAGEWRRTAEWLTQRSRVVALDARGHGASERRPSDVSLDAHAADSAYAIERLELGPTVVVGQSLGGQAAILVAAGRPDLVRALVIVDADPELADDRTVAEVEQWLNAWPVPFGSRRDALDFFGGSAQHAAAWADGLERRDGEWWPRFEIDVITRTLREAASRSYWNEWGRVRCPTLVVQAENGGVPPATAAAMVERLSRVRRTEIADAGHDLHLDRPAEWRTSLSEFLDSIDAPPA